MARDDLAEGLNRHTETESIGGRMSTQIVVKNFCCLELPRTYPMKNKTE